MAKLRLGDDFEPYDSILGEGREPLQDLSLAGQVASSQDDSGNELDDVEKILSGLIDPNDPYGGSSADAYIPNLPPSRLDLAQGQMRKVQGYPPLPPTSQPVPSPEEPSDMDNALSTISKLTPSNDPYGTRAAQKYVPMHPPTALDVSQGHMRIANGLPPLDQVKQIIAKRQGIKTASSLPPSVPPKAPSVPVPTPDSSPPPSQPSGETPAQDSDSMYNDAEKEALLGANLSQNMGQAMAQAAQGSNTPQINNALYSNMQSQSNNFIKGELAQSALRQKVAQAIKDQQFKAQQNDLNRKSVLEAAKIRASNKPAPLSLEDRIKLKGAPSGPKAGSAPLGPDGTPIGPKASMKDIQNIERTLNGVDAAQHVTDMIHGSDAGAFGYNTGIIGKMKSVFGQSNPATEDVRNTSKAQQLPIAATMAQGRPTDIMLKKVKDVMPDIDMDSKVAADSKASAMMNKLFTDAEGPVKALEASGDPRAPQYRARLEQQKATFKSKLKEYQDQQAQAKFPKRVFKDGKQATVQNQNELNDAMDKGWQER